MGRALIADSHLVEQYATGRKDEICPCVACGQGYVGNADKIIPSLHPHPALGPGSLHARLGVANTHGIFAADGDYYAETLAHRVGVDRIGGWIRVGFAPYNTEEEAELLVRAVREIAAG